MVSCVRIEHLLFIQSVQGDCLCQIQVWVSCFDFSGAGAPEGKNTWPSAQQPVLCWVPRTISSGHPYRSVCPKNGSPSAGFLEVSASGRGWSWSSCYLGGAQTGELRSWGLWVPLGQSDPEWILEKAHLWLGLKGPGKLGRMKSEEGMMFSGGEGADLM